MIADDLKIPPGFYRGALTTLSEILTSVRSALMFLPPFPITAPAFYKGEVAVNWVLH